MPQGSHTGALWRAGVPPGVYERIAPSVRPRDVKLDVAAFVGLTERGPVATPVAIGSWSEYQATFGGTGGGRQTPDAVWLFFANGGRRAVVSRALVYAKAETARHRLPEVGDTEPLELWASDPGAWGDSLTLAWTWTRRPVRSAPTGLTLTGTPDTYTAKVPAGDAPPLGTCLRTTWTYGGAPFAGSDAVFLVTGVRRTGDDVELTLLVALPMVPAGGTVAATAPWEEVRARLDVALGSRKARYDDLGLHPDHPDHLGKRLDDDALVRLATGKGLLLPWDASAGAPAVDGFRGAGVWTTARRSTAVATGSDAAPDTGPDVFFDPIEAGNALSEHDAWAERSSPLDALDSYDDEHLAEPVSLVCLPDLYHPVVAATITEDAPVDCGTVFTTCSPDPEPTVADVELDWPLLTDPAVGPHQARLVEWAEARIVVAILDLPPQLTSNGVATWHRDHRSMRAAAYAPYLRLAPPEDPLAALRPAPPCGAVCGVIARQERLVGVHAAPANAAVLGVVGLAADPLLPDPGFLHEERVNLLRLTEVGLRVMGSRTLSADLDWTHLSVRRLVDWLERQLRLDCQWAPFEPNNERLWRRLVLTAERRLRQVGAAGAWAGATPATSWFVRCDASTHTQTDLDQGRTIVLVGVAPSVPAEFLVFQIALQRDGELSTEGLDG